MTGFTSLPIPGADEFVSPPLRVKVDAPESRWDICDTIVLSTSASSMQTIVASPRTQTEDDISRGPATETRRLPGS